MQAAKPVAFALLAAGQSRRFGAEDKLCTLFQGDMLGVHAARSLAPLLPAPAWVIASSDNHPCAAAWRELGFAIAVNQHAEEGMGGSVALAAQLAKSAGAGGLLVCLADMPLVPTSHFEAVRAHFLAAADRKAIAASAQGDKRMPPACFGEGHFEALMSLGRGKGRRGKGGRGKGGGDKGARALLSQGEVVGCPDKWLADVDSQESLAALSRS
jgi:CTP:molybdopterin cytidylyltransferase MocA